MFQLGLLITIGGIILFLGHRASSRFTKMDEEDDETVTMATKQTSSYWSALVAAIKDSFWSMAVDTPTTIVRSLIKLCKNWFDMIWMVCSTVVLVMVHGVVFAILSPDFVLDVFPNLILAPDTMALLFASIPLVVTYGMIVLSCSPEFLRLEITKLELPSIATNAVQSSSPASSPSAARKTLAASSPLEEETLAMFISEDETESELGDSETESDDLSTVHGCGYVDSESEFGPEKDIEDNATESLVVDEFEEHVEPESLEEGDTAVATAQCSSRKRPRIFDGIAPARSVRRRQGSPGPLMEELASQETPSTEMIQRRLFQTQPSAPVFNVSPAPVRRSVRELANFFENHFPVPGV